MSDLNAQDITNMAWAFTTASQSDVKLFVALALGAELHVSAFDMQSLANTAWAFAKAGQ